MWFLLELAIRELKSGLFHVKLCAEFKNTCSSLIAVIYTVLAILAILAKNLNFGQKYNFCLKYENWGMNQVDFM